jgi:hypothetical protein
LEEGSNDFYSLSNQKSKIKNLKLQNSSPAPKQRGAFRLKAYLSGLPLERLAELFSSLFYVAASCLNSPRLSGRIETFSAAHVKTCAEFSQPMP